MFSISKTVCYHHHRKMRLVTLSANENYMSVIFLLWPQAPRIWSLQCIPIHSNSFNMVLLNTIQQSCTYRRQTTLSHMAIHHKCFEGICCLLYLAKIFQTTQHCTPTDNHLCGNGCETFKSHFPICLAAN